MIGMICGACDDCDSTVLYLTNPPQVKCKRSGKLHFVTDHCDATSAQPDVTDINVGDINKFIDGLEEIFADIRERHVDDSVCGLCEYDGAYMGQSGDWCNECPGFDRDDCFRLSDKCRKQWIDTITNSLPSAQSEIIRCKDCEWFRKEYGWNCIEYTVCGISPMHHPIRREEDFCSMAERREE